MTTTALVEAAAGSWTVAYEGAGTVTIGIQNRSRHVAVLVHVDTTLTVAADWDDEAEELQPGEFRSYAVKSGDKVHVQPVGDDAARVIVRA